MTSNNDAAETGTEVERALNAVQAAALDDTLPRELREAQVMHLWATFGDLALVAAAQLAANRATLGLRAAEASGARSLPTSELRRMVPSAVPPQVREAAIDLLVLLRRPWLNWDEIDRRREVIMTSTEPFDVLVALLTIANGLATLLVEFSPEYDSVYDVVRAEALRLEQQV